jgi:hypothetical protein
LGTTLRTEWLFLGYKSSASIRRKTNPNGGAIALGHPISATGALLTATSHASCAGARPPLASSTTSPATRCGAVHHQRRKEEGRHREYQAGQGQRSSGIVLDYVAVATRRRSATARERWQKSSLSTTIQLPALVRSIPTDVRVDFRSFFHTKDVTVMHKRDAAILSAFIGTVPFFIFVLAKGLAGEGKLANALSAPDDYLLAFGVGVTVLAAITAARSKVQVTRLFCQAVLLLLISACCYTAMTVLIDKHLALNSWFAGMIVVSMIGAVVVAWQYMKAAL